MSKTIYTNVKVKELLANPKIQSVLKELVDVPQTILVKQVRNPYTNPQTNEVTQKIHALSGTSLIDVMELDITLTGGQTLDPIESINKQYKIEDFNVALDANMHNGNFGGYAATGLKLFVTKLIPEAKDNK